MIDPRQSVASIVLEHPASAPVLVGHRIDFCCQGDLSLEAACTRRGLATAEVVGEVEQAIAGRADPVGDRRSTPTPMLVAHLVGKHHAYLRQALPYVRELAAKVGRVHGDRDPRLRALAVAVGELADAFTPQLAAEETGLFAEALAPHPDLALVGRELASMRQVHLVVGGLLERIRDAAADFAVPDWACSSYRALVAELGYLEADVFEHVHLEEHVLRPRLAAHA